MYAIHYTNGHVSGGHESTQACLDEIDGLYPDYYAGHDGDLSEGGDRTLVWRNEAESEGDDGARAIASIRREAPVKKRTRCTGCLDKLSEDGKLCEQCATRTCAKCFAPAATFAKRWTCGRCGAAGLLCNHPDYAKSRQVKP